jgi:hypothetical protein
MAAYSSIADSAKLAYLVPRAKLEEDSVGIHLHGYIECMYDRGYVCHSGADASCKESNWAFDGLGVSAQCESALPSCKSWLRVKPSRNGTNARGGSHGDALQAATVGKNSAIVRMLLKLVPMHESELNGMIVRR